MAHEVPVERPIAARRRCWHIRRSPNPALAAQRPSDPCVDPAPVGSPGSDRQREGSDGAEVDRAARRRQIGVTGAAVRLIRPSKLCRWPTTRRSGGSEGKQARPRCRRRSPTRRAAAVISEGRCRGRSCRRGLWLLDASPPDEPRSDRTTVSVSTKPKSLRLLDQVRGKVERRRIRSPLVRCPRCQCSCEADRGCSRRG